MILKNQKIYDLVIIGAGPAGLAASIYASRFRLRHLVIGKPMSSLIAEAQVIENYPGFQSISGTVLIQKFSEQAKSYGTEILAEEVMEIKIKKLADKILRTFEVRAEREKKIVARSLIFASGTERKRLSIPGEKEFLGRGVSYCPTCDAPFYKEKIVAVIGGSGAALMAADFLSSYAKKVYIIYRKTQFRAEPIWQERIKKNKKIIPVFERNIIAIKGEEKVEEVILDKKYQGKKSLKVDGLIIEIGSMPLSQLATKIGVALTENGLIKIKSDGSTNVRGVFAAGDITTGSHQFRQVVTACAEGAIAALGVYNYLYYPTASVTKISKQVSEVNPK